MEVIFTVQIVKLYETYHLSYLVVILAFYWLEMIMKFKLKVLCSFTKGKHLKNDEFFSISIIRAPPPHCNTGVTVISIPMLFIGRDISQNPIYKYEISLSVRNDKKCLSSRTELASSPKVTPLLFLRARGWGMSSPLCSKKNNHLIKETNQTEKNKENYNGRIK
jgi:hypothetical protein